MDREVYSVTTTSIEEGQRPITHVKTEYVVGYDNAQRYAPSSILARDGTTAGKLSRCRATRYIGRRAVVVVF